ncbi:hypothetical protein [Herbaspirillum rhizosphaerae]|uniref:hypothetical protein n=1 Tax=Herbaspirillum rhizosphaerae TaxID=346179 RepID=UPI00067DC212|nr:hypothetical protein [Herbaspirillum rhizosphaerae]
MFVDSMILHAMAEAQSEQSGAMNGPAPASTTGAGNPDEEMKMPTQKQMQQEMSQSQQQGQQAPHVQKDVQETAPAKPYTDPLGRPLYQGTPRFTDQQAGGDLTGDESDARDDNYVATGSGQNTRDVSAHADRLPAASQELLRSIAVPSASSGVKEKSGLPAVAQQAATVPETPEPDGTEDPGANVDDGLMPGKRDGSASEQH